MKENADFFMGLDPLSTMTSQGKWQLTVRVVKNPQYINRQRVERTLTAKYSGFRISQYPDYTLDYDKLVVLTFVNADACKSG